MVKNKKLIIILSFVIVFAITIFVVVKSFFADDVPNPNSKTFVVLSDNLEVDVYSDVKISDFVTIKEGKLIDDKVISTLKVGDIKVSYSYLNDYNEKISDSFYLRVVDNEKPYVMLGNSYTYVIGNDFVMESSVFCGDNVTKRPKCYIVGDYDLTTVGEYPLVFRAEDESGNINDIDFTLRVIEKKNTASSSSRISFEEINDMLPDDASLMIDVSKWQADIDWQKVADSGIEYAMLRLGTQKGIDLDSRIDTYFDKNIKEAQEVGIKVGVYYFTYANDVEDAFEQAKWVIDVLSNYDIDLPVAFDWECWNYFDEFNINFYELNMIADTFLKKIEKAGYDVLLYGSKNYIENVWTYLDYDIWLAHYTKNTSYTGPKMMWQFTSSGEVPGVNGNVDVNFYYNK